jgi:hypothetical protein
MMVFPSPPPYSIGTSDSIVLVNLSLDPLLGVGEYIIPNALTVHR